jgi:hypothetical protein
MSKEIESISSALFDKIRSRFTNVTLGDEKAKACSDPSEARFFNFTYADKSGAEFGKVTLSLIDETSLKVYYGQNISSEMDREQRREWFEFLRNLRQFAKRNLLTFDTRDINKSNLELQDVKQQSKADDVATTSDIQVTESKLYGTSRNSYADMGECRILIKHDGLVNDEKRGDRARRIREIFIETPAGERLLVPHKNLHGARALACHLNNNGDIRDEFAEHINELVQEMSAMRHFVRSTKSRQFEDQETADMTQAAVRHYDQVKNVLKRLSHPRYRDEYIETFQPQHNIEDDIDVDSLRERFVKKVYDDRFNDALPFVYRAYKQQQRESAVSDVGSELEEWADVMAESDWNRPDNSDKLRALEELLKTPLMAGIDGIDAQSKLEPVIGDDDLNDAIFHLSQGQGPDVDCRPLVKTWLEEYMPELLSKLNFGEKNSDDGQTNYTKPVSPQASTGDEYGAGPSATQNDHNMTFEETDPLAFIRTLAGLVK